MYQDWQEYVNMALQHAATYTIARSNQITKRLSQGTVIACVNFFIQRSYTACKRKGNIVWKTLVRKQHFGQPISAVHIVCVKAFAQHLRKHLCTLHVELVIPTNRDFLLLPYVL